MKTFTNQEYIKLLYAFLAKNGVAKEFDKHLANESRRQNCPNFLETIITEFGAEYLINCVAPLSSPTARNYNKWDYLNYDWTCYLDVLNIENELAITDNISNINEVKRYLRLVPKKVKKIV